MLKVSRSGYYKYINSNLSPRQLENYILSEKILNIFKEHNGNYGSKRICEELNKRGINVNRKRITRLMRIMHLYPKRTKYVYITHKKNFSNIKHQKLLNQLYEINEKY